MTDVPEMTEHKPNSTGDGAIQPIYKLYELHK